MSTKLIVGADDFGWTRGINKGILEAYNNGIVRAASLMVNEPYAEEAVQAAKNHPGLDIGIHLNIAHGRPVLPIEDVQSLVDEKGNFFPLKKIELRAIKGKFKLEELVAEFKAQIGRAFEFGIKPSHIDSHQHVHIFPTIYRAIPLAMEGLSNVPIRGYFYKLVLSGTQKPWIEVIKYYVRNPLRLATHKWASFVTYYFGSKGIPKSDAMLIHIPQKGEPTPKTTIKGWCNIIAAAKNNCINEIFCHPGYMDGGYCGNYKYEREKEISALTSPEVMQAIKISNIQLCGYSKIFNNK